MLEALFISPADGAKPETVVTGEFIGDAIRILGDDEIVHYREDNNDPICAKCSKPALVWFDYEHRWERSPQRCA